MSYMHKFNRSLQVLLIFILTFTLVSPVISYTGPSREKAHPSLIQTAETMPEQIVKVIVQKSRSTTHPEERVGQLNGRVIRNLPIINAFSAELPALAAVQLSKDPDVRWVSPDAAVVEVSGTDENNLVILRADFAQANYYDASSNWNQTWLELGEADGAGNGDVAIVNFLSGTAQGVRLQGTSKGIQSILELPQTNSASLTIGYRRKGLTSEAEYVAVQISTNGGIDWVDLDHLGGAITDPTLSIAQYDLSPYLSGELMLRFVTSEAFNQTSKFYLDYVQVDYLASPKPEPVFAYSVRLPLVVNYKPQAVPGMGNISPLSINYEYSETVRDEFTGGTFNGNNGSASWNGQWNENDLAGAGPTSGNIKVINGELRLTNRYSSGTLANLNRGVNLAKASAALFTFDYHTSRDVDPTDAVVVEVSSDSGATFSILQTYTDIHGEVWGNGYFDLTPYLSASTRVRFRILSYYSGYNEYFYVDNIQIAYAPRLGETVRDEFSQVSYQSNDGTLLWGNDWVEYDPNGGNGATDGYVYVDLDGKLHFTYVWEEYIQRSVDLSGSNQAILSFNWQTVGLDEGERLSVLVSSDGVAPFVEVGVMDGNQSGYFSYDITPFISSNTTIRFENNAEAIDFGEYINIDDVQIAFESECPQCFSTAGLKNTFVRSIGADLLWNDGSYLQGQNVTVAVVDSGISPHPDFSGENGESRILAHVDFLSQGNQPDDFYGHGTHVAGSIGGNGSSSDGQYPGVAPKVNLVDVKVMDDQGIGTTSDVVAGLQWIYENKDIYNIRVVNLSLNSTVEESYNNSALDAALEVLWFNGIVVIVSAGNNGTYASGVVYPPANDPFVITVGAADDMGTRDTSDDFLASFSAFGNTADGFSKPDIIVPGRNIISPLASDDCNLIIAHPANAVSGENGTFYFRMSGTSMASGVAAGAVALLLQEDPTLNPDQVKHRLLGTAHHFDYGNHAGYLDIYQAVHSEILESSNIGIDASQLLWTGSEPITWGSVAWNSVAWNSVAWNSVAWNSVAWNSVAWNSVSWEP